MKLLFKAFMSKTVTLVCVDAACSDLNLWDDNKAQKTGSSCNPLPLKESSS